MEFRKPQYLGMQRSFEMIAAPRGKTFRYRNEDKRIIEPGWRDEHRLRKIMGPLIYAVTDSEGVVRYFGKWVSQTPLYARWFRHDRIHHQTSSRKKFIEALDAGKSPLTVWSAAAGELRRLPMPKETSEFDDQRFIENLEALWIQRWRSQLWNKQVPSLNPGFSDGNFWQSAAS